MHRNPAEHEMLRNKYINNAYNLRMLLPHKNTSQKFAPQQASKKPESKPQVEDDLIFVNTVTMKSKVGF